MKCGDMLKIYHSISLLSSHSVATCWLLVGEIPWELNLIYDIYCYDTYVNSWQLGPNMKNIRYQCLAAVLNEDCLLVVGGMCNDSVEIGSLQ